MESGPAFSSSNVRSRIANDVILLSNIGNAIISSPEVESKPKAKNRCWGRIRTSVHNIVGHNGNTQAKCSIRDPDIENRNRVILK